MEIRLKVGHMDACEALRVIRHSLHDLAQPLAAVTGLVDLLLLEQSKNCGHLEEIQLISEKLEEVLEIIAQIRATARQAVPEMGDEAPGLERRVC